MKVRVAMIVLLATALGGAFAPAAALSESCAVEAGTDCCELDSTLCLCCSHVPRTAAAAAGGVPLATPVGCVGAEDAAAPPGPFPRDVLHVPRPSSTR